MKSISASLLALLLFVNVACAADPLESRRVQSPPDELPTCTIQRTATGIVVDGEADDADWQRATPIPFVSPWNDVEKEGNQATVARMLWDDDNLYIVYVCQDPYLDSEVTEHDGPVYEEDAVEIFATPNADDVGTYYGYEMNINGAILDYIAFEGGAERTKDIQFPWESEGVQIATTYDGTLNDHSDTDRNWILEIAIPFDNYRHLGGTIPPQDGDLWRLNLNRTAGYKGQFNLWSDTHTPTADFHRAIHFGRAIFSTTKVEN